MNQISRALTSYIFQHRREYASTTNWFKRDDLRMTKCTTTGVARRISNVNPPSRHGERFERQTFNTSTSMDLGFGMGCFKRTAQLISSFRRHKARRDRARTSLHPSITKASKIHRQVFDGNPRTIGLWLAFISTYIAICNARYRCHRNSILSRWSISNVAWLYALAEFRMWQAKSCSFEKK